MAAYLGMYEEPSDITQQQERHYYLLSELQSLVKDLSSSCQQRLSHTILSDLALALIDGTVFEIVQGLLEIQHLTEKNLYNQRVKLHAEHKALKQDLLRRHKDAQQSCKAHNVHVLRTSQQRELESLKQRIREEQRMMDEKIVLELDQKVIDQQSTLEKAGVSGFYVTTNPQCFTDLVHGITVTCRGFSLLPSVPALCKYSAYNCLTILLPDITSLPIIHHIRDTHDPISEHTCPSASPALELSRTSSKELTLQMNLLELIRKLQQKESMTSKMFS